MISPTSPAGNSRTPFQSTMGASSIAMMRTTLGATTRPTQVPAPASVAARVCSSSRPSITATGRHSVAPYGVQNCASSGSSLRMRATTSGGTGAPAEVTRFTFGSGWPWSARTRIKAGEPNSWVTPKRAMASCSRFRSAWAGRVGSMSGMTDVSPNAGSNKANGGNVGRSTPPACMPKAERSSSICPTKWRWR